MEDIENNPNKTLKVCPECDRPIYYKNKDKKYVCYNCKTKVNIVNERPYSDRWDSNKRKKREINDADLLTRDELLIALKHIDGENILRDQAFISFIYLTAARVEEVVGVIHQKTRKRLTEPIKMHQIVFYELDNAMYMVVNKMPILKRKPKNDNIPTRNVPIFVENEKEFVNYIKEYIKDMDKEDPLFKMTYQNAWRISSKVNIKEKFTAFNHYWRHLRLTHLAEIYGFSDLDLQQYVGWANALMAGKYTHFNWQTLAKKQRTIKYIQR